MTISIRRHWPLLQHKRFARNGQVPEASFLRGLINRQNSIVSYRRKCFMKWGDVTNPFTGAAGTTTLWRFRGHVGYAATHIEFHFGALPNVQGNGTAPSVTFDVTEAGGSTTSLTVELGHDAGHTDNLDSPAEIGWHTARVAVTANTTYEVAIKAVDWARPFAMTAYEIAPHVVDTTIEPFVDSQQGAYGFPVFDSTRQDILEGLSNLWRRNGAHLLTYAGSGTGTELTNTGTSYINIIDGSTVVAASSAGYYLDGLENRCRISSPTTINVVLAVHASTTAASNAVVRLQDSTGTRASVTNIGATSQWYTTTTTITSVDTMDKVDIQSANTAAGTLTVNAVSLYAYLA